MIDLPRPSCGPVVAEIIAEFDDGKLRRPTRLTPKEWFDVVTCLKTR